MKEDERRRALVAWVTEQVMPHEPWVRAWLARSKVARDDADDLIQEAYCRISMLDSVAHIERPGAFFFQAVRNIRLNQIKKERVVRIDSVVEVDLIAFHDDTPSPERITGDRQEWARLRSLMSRLPERCRRIFEMRKVDGLSQREIATQLGITENVVENESANGLRMIISGLRDQGDAIAEEYEARRSKRERRS